jgi:hypothetical protein
MRQQTGTVARREHLQPAPGRPVPNASIARFTERRPRRRWGLRDARELGKFQLYGLAHGVGLRPASGREGNPRPAFDLPFTVSKSCARSGPYVPCESFARDARSRGPWGPRFDAGSAIARG